MDRNITRIAPLLGLMLVSSATVLFGREYCVAPGGSDEARGTQSQPFRTIQKAADVAKPGDVCYVAPGIYRETVTPGRSGTKCNPIVFRAASGRSATIVGSEPVTGWKKHSGHRLF